MGRVSGPRRLLGASLDLKPGQEIAPTDLAELLIDAGFSREDPADEHGEFALRGGILDIFPAGETLPVRLEFVGDTIESLRTYDPGTQRSIAPIDQITIVPLTDTLADLKVRTTTATRESPATATGQSLDVVQAFRSAADVDRTATVFDYDDAERGDGRRGRDGDGDCDDR